MKDETMSAFQNLALRFIFAPPAPLRELNACQRINSRKGAGGAKEKISVSFAVRCKYRLTDELATQSTNPGRAVMM
jgi:hypothetical protein